MDVKIEIKEEDAFSEITSQTERESFSQEFATKLNSDAFICNKVCKIEIKTEIKEEAVDSDACAQNEWGFFSDCAVIKVNECSNNFEPDTKIEIKEELHSLERNSLDAPCTDEVNKGCLDESFPSTESIRLFGKEVSRGKSVLFSDEESEETKQLCKRKDNHECKATTKYKTKEGDIPEISSTENNVNFEQYDEGKSSCLKQKDLDQHNSTQKRNSYKKNVLVRDDMSCKYRCSICGKAFLSPSGLRRHKFHHDGKRPHQCNICQKSFSEFSDLRVHKLIHEGQKPHKCDICEKSFTQLSNLKTHKLIHEGSKPHRCNICEKAFTRLTDLRRHKLIHEGVRPHKCDICGNSFTHLSTLKTHKMIHEGKKTLKCNICGNGYTQLPSFLRHKLIHENKKPYKLNTG